ncbi:MAG: hypothetical protein LIQ31_07755 [Planctomycetes bacterium]|nr:hypothetical protein [Planctomycetota bacterium]
MCDAFLPKIIALHDEKPSKSEPYIFLAINIPRMYREFFRKGYLKPSQLNASTSLNFSNGVKIYTFFLALSFLATFPEKEKIRRSQARFIRLYYRRYSPLVLRPVVIPLVRYFTRRRRTTPKTHQSASLRWLTAIIPLFKDLFKIFFNKKANE